MQQSAGKREAKGGRRQRTSGGGVLKADGALRLQEVEVVQQEDKRRRWCVVRARGKGKGGGGATTQQPVRANYPLSVFLVLSFALSYT